MPNGHETRGENASANPDPITGEHGSHPVGTALGSAGGAATGAAIGAAMGGPVGAAVGGVIGAVAGGAAGHAAGEALDPTAEANYWRSAYGTRPYTREDRRFEDFEPAYRQGWESAVTVAAERTFDDVENELERTWPTVRGSSRVEWEDARAAARDSWERVRARAGSEAAATAPTRIATPE
jgi:phage tail tape-measure protein